MSKKDHATGVRPSKEHAAAAAATPKPGAEPARPPEARPVTPNHGEPPVQADAPASNVTPAQDAATSVAPGDTQAAPESATVREGVASPPAETSATDFAAPSVAEVALPPSAQQQPPQQQPAHRSPHQPTTRTAAVAQEAAAMEPGVEDVMAAIAGVEPPGGYHATRPEPRLTAEEAQTQAAIYKVLKDRGVPIRDMGGVYPWLLRQIRKETIG